ncbi:MAG: hypothetical protein ABI885_15880 [Gammaproteobacteria bacterium]
MSVTNLHVQDPTVANRYLTGQLSDAERAAFEAELGSNPAALAELEATARLKVGLAKLRERGDLTRELQRAPSYRLSMVLALAATLTAVVIGVSLWRGDFARSGAPLLAATATSFVDAQGSALPIAETVALFRKRVDAFDAVVEQPATRQTVEFRVLPQSPEESAQYRVSLARMQEDGSLDPETSAKQLHIDAEGFVTVFADASRLEPGRYRLAVSKDHGAGSSAPDYFVIRVVPGRSH